MPQLYIFAGRNLAGFWRLFLEIPKKHPASMSRRARPGGTTGRGRPRGSVSANNHAQSKQKQKQKQKLVGGTEKCLAIQFSC